MSCCIPEDLPGSSRTSGAEFPVNTWVLFKEKTIIIMTCKTNHVCSYVPYIDHTMIIHKCVSGHHMRSITDITIKWTNLNNKMNKTNPWIISVMSNLFQKKKSCVSNIDTVSKRKQQYLNNVLENILHQSPLHWQNLTITFSRLMHHYTKCINL